MTKVYKRYANRKLYDTERSVYVNLTQIAENIISGHEVTIIDNVTKEDITGPILLSAIVEREQDLSGQVVTLCDIIKKGGITQYVTSLKGNSQ